MSDDDETHVHVTYASHWDMDDAFCARMRMAIEAGLESAPVGVITTPGTKNPKIHPHRALLAKLFVGQHGLLVGDNINHAVMSLRLVLRLERVPCLAVILVTAHPTLYCFALNAPSSPAVHIQRQT